ncbi:MAG: metallophosphoesterase, partial [Clostridia bacterium]|nr:metallophosphoesterase [Clostridia bacterium]
NHRIVTLQDGLVVRDVTINSGVAGTEKTEIAFLTDPHLNYINEKDISTGNINALASYRGRDWLRDLSQMSNLKKAMKFACMFKKTVMGGDSVDYLSYGSLDMTKRLFTDKSVNGSIKMTVGNHEYMETCQPDTSGLTQQYSLEQRYAIVQQYWANDVYFDYEIMKKENGADNVMLIYMDNAANKYRSSQLTKLTNALNEARSKNIPVLIFQHSPILTMNPNETSVYLWEGYANIGGSYVLGNTRFATSENKTGTVNMTSHSGYPGLGSSNSDTTTKAVCELIMQNYDIIKGVFHGHEHSNMYTEIVGHDSNGNPVSSTIPQYGGFGVHYNSVMKITIQ